MIYLDSAATTLHKPPEVSRAVLRAMQSMSSPGRGGHQAAQAAEETVFRCRNLAASYFDVPSPEQVALTFNATHGLNIAIKTLIPRGGRALISAWEHNAVTRPLHALGAEVIVARAPLFDRAATLRAFEERLSMRPDAVICTHVSNVFGFLLPIEEIAKMCQMRGIPFIVDASQSAGIVPLSMRALGAEFIAMPGHKSLYGPQGSGLLLCKNSAVPLLEGGTGSASIAQEMPDFLPDRLEAGTANVPAIAGLAEGLRFVMEKGARIRAYEDQLLQRAGKGLRQIPGVTAYTAPEQIGVVSFSVAGHSPEEVAGELADRSIAVRAGLHCAPLAHESAGTLPEGTVRLSVSAFSRGYDIDLLLRAVRQIAQKKHR